MTLPGLVYVGRPVSPPPRNPDPGWDGLVMSWTGWDGTTIPLTSPHGGIEMKAGIEGLLMPTFERHVDSSPARAGAFWRGRSTKERPCFWPIRFYNDENSNAFTDSFASFVRTMHPDRPGYWSVRSRKGTRTLKVRYEKGMEGALERDPTFFGWIDLGISLVAEQPFWEGETIFRTWEAPDIRDFIDQENGSPDFYISDATSTASATMSNPGDEDAYPIWIVHGPVSAASITLSGRKLDIPFPIPAGKALTIDTRPTEQNAVDSDGVDRTAELGSYSFLPIPPGVALPFEISLLGQGALGVALTPLYWTAF